MERKIMLRESVIPSIGAMLKRLKNFLILELLLFVLEEDANFLIKKWGLTNDDNK